MREITQSCHKTERCTNVHVLTVVKIPRFHLNQNKADLYTARNVFQTIRVEDFRLVVFD